MIINAECGKPLVIGIGGEDQVTAVTFDISAWVEAYGAGVPELLHRRAGDSVATPVQVTFAGGIVTWPITAADTAYQGVGEAQLIYTPVNRTKKSEIFQTVVDRALTSPADVPIPMQGWVEQVVQAGAVAEAALPVAQAAVEAAQTVIPAAEAAQAAASAAQASELQAAASAASAASDSTDAMTAKTAAETAQTAAEAAQAAAEAAAAHLTIDDTLTNEGQAADAKAAGDRLNTLGEEITDITGNALIPITGSGYIPLSGSTTDLDSPTSSATAKYIVAACAEGDTFTVTTVGGSGARAWGFVRSDRTTVIGMKAAASATCVNTVVTAPENAAYFVANAVSGNDLVVYQGEAVAITTESTRKRLDEISDDYGLAYNLAPGFCSFPNRTTTTGVTYTWNAEHTACTITGSSTSGDNSASLWLGSADTGFPGGFRSGRAYFFDVRSSDGNGKIGLYWYRDGSMDTAHRVNVTEPQWVTIPEDADNFRIIIDTEKSVETLNSVLQFRIYDMNPGAVPVIDTATALPGTGFPVGTYIRTLGFNAAGDYGDALYLVKDGGEALTANGITVFEDANGNCIERVFDKPYVWLESLDVENKPWATVDSIIAASGVPEARANRLNLDHSLEISKYDFSFVRLTTTGSFAGPALLLYDMSNRRVTGKYIDARNVDNAYGLRITNRDANFAYNRIDIQMISATGYCVDIRPSEGHGILDNDYYFERLGGVKHSGANSTGPVAGIRTYISAKRSPETGLPATNPSTGKVYYSYEGEDRFHVNNIGVSNKRTGMEEGTARAVSLSIEIATNNDIGEGSVVTSSDVGRSIYGTITGLTFSNLSVEGSNVGIYMRSGQRSPSGSQQPESGIKSIIVDNLRVREKTRFLDLVGWFRNVRISPTSSMSMESIGRRTGSPVVAVDGIVYDPGTDTYSYPIINDSSESVVITGPVYRDKTFAGMDSYRLGSGIGADLTATKSTMYIAKRTTQQLVVTTPDDTSYDSTASPAKTVLVSDGSGDRYVLRQFYDNGYPCASRFFIADTLAGTSGEGNSTTVVLDLREYYYLESAQNIGISVPEYCTVYAKMKGVGEFKICDPQTERKDYSVSVFARRPAMGSSSAYVKYITESTVTYDSEAE